MASESLANFKRTMWSFIENALERKELMPISIEVFWSVAYGPLYALLRFENEGKSFADMPFKLTQEKMDEAFALVIKSLTP